MFSVFTFIFSYFNCAHVTLELKGYLFDLLLHCSLPLPPYPIVTCSAKCDKSTLS